MAKNFAIIGGIYQCSECGLEKIRAKTDLYNRCVGFMLAVCSGVIDAAAPWRGASRERFWRATLAVQVCYCPTLFTSSLPSAIILFDFDTFVRHGARCVYGGRLRVLCCLQRGN